MKESSMSWEPDLVNNRNAKWDWHFNQLVSSIKKRFSLDNDNIKLVYASNSDDNDSKMDEIGNNELTSDTIGIYWDKLKNNKNASVFSFEIRNSSDGGGAAGGSAGATASAMSMKVCFYF